MPDDQTPTGKVRRDRFVRVASRRTRKLLEDIQRLGNCANRSAYDYTEADVSKIFSAIEREVEKARARFGKNERKEVAFSID